MIKIGNNAIAEVGYYLTNGEINGFNLPYSDNITEIKLNEENINRHGKYLFSIGEVLFLNVSPNYNTKDKLVKSVFSIDEQIAIILNKNDNAESKKKFAVMQGWRKYFSQKIAEVKELIKKEEEENGEME